MQIAANGVALGAIYALVALGFAMMTRVTKFFDLAYAGSLTVAAYAAGCAVDAGAPLLTTIAVGPIAGMLLGFGFEVGVYRELRRKVAPSSVAIICSLGLMVVVLNAVSLVFGDTPHPMEPGVVKETLRVVSARVTSIQVGAVAGMTTAITACVLLDYRTSWGVVTRAVASDARLAATVGVAVERKIIESTVLGSALGGLAGTLKALDTGLTPTLGFQLLLPGAVATVISGGHPVGAVVAGMAVGLLQQFGGWLVSAAWQDTILFCALVAVLVLKPGGLWASR